MLKQSFIHAKYETFEFLTGDALLVSGGFLVGTDFVDSTLSTPLGSVLVGVGLFLGLRVLWKFSSDLRSIKNQVDVAAKRLQKTNVDVGKNKLSLDEAKKEFDNTKNELNITRKQLQQSMTKFQEMEKKVFGYSGSTFSRSSGFRPLDRAVDELKRKVKELENRLNAMRRGF